MKSSAPIAVYYDGLCPICRAEVRFYTRLDKGGVIGWTDINALADSALPKGKSRDELLGKFHVQEAGGDDWHIGVDAFARIWQALPGFCRAAFIFRLPLIRQGAMAAYWLFLRWQGWHRKGRCADTA